MRGGLEFTALMLRQCAAAVAVNLQIDQTAEPERDPEQPYLRGGSREPSAVIEGSIAPPLVSLPTQTRTGTISAFQTRVCVCVRTGSCTVHRLNEHVESQADQQIHSVPLEEIRMQSGSFFPLFSTPPSAPPIPSQAAAPHYNLSR